MYPVQYGGAKPLKPLPAGFRYMATEYLKSKFLGNELDYTTDVINIKTLFGYTFYETKNTIYYFDGIPLVVIKSINPKRL